MSRFKLVKNTTDNPELASLYQQALDAGFEGVESGVPVNFITSLGARPDFLSAFLNLADNILIKGLLPPAIKQMIVTIISIQNNCKYCIAKHTYALKGMGVPQELIDGLTDFNLAKVTPPQRAILEFSVKVAKDPNSMTDQDFAILRDQGLSEEEIMEVVMLVGFTNFINNWSDAYAIPLDNVESSA